MALELTIIPTLTGESAQDFLAKVEKADKEAEKNKNSDAEARRQRLAAILNKAKLN